MQPLCVCVCTCVPMNNNYLEHIFTWNRSDHILKSCERSIIYLNNNLKRAGLIPIYLLQFWHVISDLCKNIYATSQWKLMNKIDFRENNMINKLNWVSYFLQVFVWMILFLFFSRLFSTNSGPMTEVEKWKRKQKILLNITQQLKSKQCKQVISSLVAGRSKMLRKWKLIDSG